MHDRENVVRQTESGMILVTLLFKELHWRWKGQELRGTIVAALLKQKDAAAITTTTTIIINLLPV